MAEATITIKNYRCFEDSSPVILEIRPGFTALVGQNNSGKSSLLKMFFELKNLWGLLQPTQNIAALNGTTQHNVNHQGLHDPKEIFSDTNTRQIQIDIALPVSDQRPQSISAASLCLDRSQPNRWKGSCWYGKDRTPLPTQITAMERTLIRSGEKIQVDCSTFISLMTDLQRSLYIGPFRNAINQGSGSHFDLAVGTAFIELWNRWKLGAIKEQNLAIEAVTEDLRRIFEFDKLEINAAEAKDTLQINVNSKPYKLGELGAGLAQFIIVFGNAATKGPSYILIDEPELNLHPSLQVDFLTSLASYASKGAIYATHSIGLARATGDYIYSFRKQDTTSEVRPFEQTPNYAQFLGEMSFSMYQDLGYEQVLGVEGVTDVRAVHQFLRKIGKDHKIVVFPLGGDQLARGGVDMELGELKRLSAKVAMLVDSERTAEGGQPAKARQEFEQLCRSLGFNVCLTERRAFENYFSDRAVKRVYGDKYKPLGQYEKLSDSPNPWPKSDNWRIAREMKWEELEGTDMGKFLASL